MFLSGRSPSTTRNITDKFHSTVSAFENKSLKTLSRPSRNPPKAPQLELVLLQFAWHKISSCIKLVCGSCKWTINLFALRETFALTRQKKLEKFIHSVFESCDNNWPVFTWEKYALFLPKWMQLNVDSCKCSIQQGIPSRYPAKSKYFMILTNLSNLHAFGCHKVEQPADIDGGSICFSFCLSTAVNYAYATCVSTKSA